MRRSEKMNWKASKTIENGIQSRIEVVNEEVGEQNSKGRKVIAKKKISKV